MSWAEKIKSYRKRRCLIQSALAYELGVDVTTVSRWERGLVIPELSVQKKLQQMMGINQGALLADTSPGISAMWDETYTVIGASKKLRGFRPHIVGPKGLMRYDAPHPHMALFEWLGFDEFHKDVQYITVSYNHDLGGTTSRLFPVEIGGRRFIYDEAEFVHGPVEESTEIFARGEMF